MDLDFKTEIARFSPQCPQEEADKDAILSYISHFPHNVLTRDNLTAHITSSGFLVNKDATKTLLVYHNIYNSWSWTGGHADGERDLLAVALKEAEEETGATGILPLSPHIVSLDILPVWGHLKNGRYVSAHLHLSAAYLLVADEAAPLRSNPAENSGVQWFALEELDQACSEPEMLPVYHKLILRAKELLHQSKKGET